MANSAVVGNLKVILSLDTTQFDKGVTASESNVKKLSDRLSRDLVPSQQKINGLIRDFAGGRDIARALEMATAIQQVGGASKLTAKEQAHANRVVQEALDKYKALGQQAPKHLADLANATAKGRVATEQLGSGMSSLLSKARGLAGVFGVTLGAGAILGFAKNVFAAADSIADLSLKMGVSAEAAQRFQFAARQSGLELEDVARAVAHLNAGIGEGRKSGVSKALAQMGFEFSELRGLSPEQLFRTTADAIGKLSNPMQQAAAAAAVFGEKLGGALLPMIREGSLKAADGVAVMSDETVRELEKAAQAWENFWIDVKVFAAPVLLWLIGEVRKFTQDFKVGLAFLAGLIPGMPAPGALAQAMIRANQGTPAPAPLSLRERLEAGMSSHGPRFQTKAEQDAEERGIAAATAAKKRLNELYEAFERERLTGVTDAQRQAQVFEDRFFAARGLAGLPALARAIVKPQIGQLFTGSVALDSTRPLPSMASRVLPMRRPETGPISNAELMAMAKIPPARLATLVQTGVGGAFLQAPAAILAALTGGGSVGRSLGSLFGGSIGTSLAGTSVDGKFKGGLGKKLQESSLGEKLGGIVGGLIPGLGALLGPLLGKLFGAISGIGANTTKQGRVDFAKQLGFESLDNLYAKLRSLGAEGEKLANIGSSVIGKKDKAANEKWMKDVSAFFDRLERVPGKINELSAALGKFGGAVPVQLSPLLDSILGSSNLSGDLRRQLEQLRTPTWQVASDLASSFGVQVGALGRGFNQARLADTAFGLSRALGVFGQMAGSDQNAILRDMADEFSALAMEAAKNNVALPNAVKAFILQVDAMGLLLDENGNRIDTSLLQFVDIEDEYQKQVVSLLEQIRDLLAGPAPGAGGRVPGGGEEGRIWPGHDLEGRHLPTFAGGTRGRYLDFGAGTPVMLHGRERVMTEREGGAGAAGGAAGGGPAITVVAWDGESVAAWLRRGGDRQLAEAATRVYERNDSVGAPVSLARRLRTVVGNG